MQLENFTLLQNKNGEHSLDLSVLFACSGVSYSEA